MYFIVFLPPLQRNVLIPVEWIFDIENHLEKFINHGLNSNQWFLCYYTTNPDAFIDAFTDDQQPDKNFVPDFTLDLITKVNARQEFDGVFFGNLVRFKHELDGGNDFVSTHRNVRPPIYNLRRIKEMPLPSLGIHANHLDQFYASGYVGDSSSEGEESADSIEFERAESETDADASNEFGNTDGNDDSFWAPNEINTNRSDNNVSGGSIEADASVADSANSQDQGTVENGDDSLSAQNENISNPLANNVPGGSTEADASVENGANALVQAPVENENDANEPLIDQIANEDIDEVDPLQNPEHQLDIKPDLVPLYEIHARNISEMNDLLDEPQTIYLSDDDGEMVVPETGLPKPFGTTKENIVKRENDPITGNVPFNVEHDYGQNGKPKLGRVYKIGGKMILVPEKAVEKLIEWNEPPKRHDVSYDRKVCYSWLLSLSGKEQIAAFNVDTDTMNFIKDCFIIRCDDQEDRINSIEKFKNELCQAGGLVKNVVISD